MCYTYLFDDNSENILGLPPQLKGLFVYEKFLQLKRSVIFVTSTLYEANKYFQIISDYTNQVCLFPMDDFLSSFLCVSSPELKTTRLETLNSLKNSNKIIVTNLMGLLKYLPLKSSYYDSFIQVDVGKEYDMNKIIKMLLDNGYERETVINKTGQIAIRGFVLDVFPVNADNPIRIEFWGDMVDKISEFNIDTQLSIKKINNVIISPNNDFSISTDKKATIIDYVSNPVLIYNDYKELLNNYNILLEDIKSYKQSKSDCEDLIDIGKLSTRMCKTQFFLSEFHNKITDGSHKDYQVKSLSNLSGTFEEINQTLNNYINNNKTVIICLSSIEKVRRLKNHLNNNLIVITDKTNIVKNKINIIKQSLHNGFVIENYVIISEKELFNTKENKSSYKTKFKVGTTVRNINKLEKGDYVVHNIHGIGIYQGIKTLEKNGLKKDYLMILYKDNDKVYIPVEKIEMIKKYSSNEGRKPKINKLGSTDWAKTKARVKSKVENIAGDLLKLYSERESSKGFAFSKDGKEQIDFEKDFPYTETKDQLKVVDEIKRDMEKNIPMDRLLCGDVGYGKTEVAFRAIFKAIMDGKQVIMLCPTTLLSTQHYQNAIERFKNCPIDIEVLNRFVPKKKQEKILKNLEEGKIDLIIGTHRLLSSDVKLKNLGLLVIDEEQRFGVKHKEKIKEYKTNIDVLTLTATPIPRTLQMSMAGIRSLSLIETPPVDRYPVQTYVVQENTQIIRDSIYRELSREGQVFILYNDIASMMQKLSELKKLVPEARIVCAHGKMQKHELEDIMQGFINKEYDVLLCTTIIETGIDIPSVNTLIIYDADRFGLAQLYQIRGRVGRSNKISYCYLMYNQGKILSEIAKKRLNVIKDFTQLGSGFAIAIRDLSIRGAGDILGSEQAGFVDSVGIELFLEMLNEEVDKLKGKEIKNTKETTQPAIDVETNIKDSYVSEEDLKIEIHQKISNIESIEKLNKTKEELEDRFGRLDESIIIYMHEQLFEHIIKKLDITDIRQTKNSIVIMLPKEMSNQIDGKQLFVNTIELSRNFRFSTRASRILITLDIINLDKHFIYYLIDFLGVLEKSLESKE